MNNNETYLSTYMNLEHGRRAELYKDTYHYIVRMFEDGELKQTELLENKTINYAEDLAENYVQKWGTFK